MVGSTLDHYRIDTTLGTGGMGIVYQARDMHLDRLVAIKVLRADRIADPARKQRFIQEAKAASALNHPNIVTIHDIRAHEGVDFIVMEYVAGHTLAELIPSNGMRTPQALKYAVQMADALSKAHSAGIVHRDLKPANVMVTEEGRIKILDFGLAKLLEPAQVSSERTTIAEPPLTEEGAVVGTPAYMSPEQAEARTVDARSDLFSFGAILYETVTGRKPFAGDSWLAVLSSILKDDPTPPRQLAATVSPDLEKTILRCLRKDPARRFQTAADLKVALEDVEGESRAPKQTQQLPSRWRWAWAALLPVILAAGFFASRASRGPESMDPLRAVPLTTLPGVSRYPSFSPDGNYVAFTWTGPKQNNPDVYVQQIGVGSPLRLTNDPSNDYNPVWSPDGRWIAFLRSQSAPGKSDLRLIPPLGGPERRLGEVRVRGGISVTPPYLGWFPDSKNVVVTDSPGERQPDALFVMSLETGEKRQLTNPLPPASGDTNPAVSPDGSWLVFRRQAGGVFAGELYRLPLRKDMTVAGEPRRLTPAVMDALYPTWLPGSKEVLLSAKGSLWRLDVSSGTQPARLPFVGEDGLMPVISRPQPGRPPRLVYVRSFEDTNIWRLESSDSGATAYSPPAVFISSTRGEWFPVFAPNGRRVAFASDRMGGGGIWVADVDGSNVLQLAAMGAFATGAPQWSPDGERIVFHSNPLGQGDVFIISAAGGTPRNLTNHPANDSFPSFSRDGKWIYFSSDRNGGQRQIWKIPVSGGTPVQVPSSFGYAPVESPDGAYIYYVETLERPSPVWRMPVSGGVAVKVLESVVLSNFVVSERGIYYIDRPSDQGVYYRDKPSGETRLQYFDFATRKSSTMAQNLGNVGNFLTVSPDGRTILYSRVDSSVDDLMLVENFR